MDYKKAIQKKVEESNAKKAAARILYLELLRTCPDLYETEKRIRNAKMDLRRGKNIDGNELVELERTRRKILTDRGITENMLNPPPTCAKCNDTGLVGGKPCSCIISKCASDGMANPSATFDQCDLSIFPKAERERISKVYATASAFCDKFPLTNKLNLLYFGKCGSGKTYLASCIANQIAAKGYSAIMLSAFAFNNRLWKYHTTFDSDKLSYIEPLIDCDLLIIDDLGSENIMKNVTVEYLFHIINERMTANKHTVFTTNLDGDMILARYGERTYSRLFGSRQSIGFALSDADLRKQ